MKRGRDVLEELQKTTHDIPVEIRDTLGRISLSLKKIGMKKAKVIEVFHSAGYDIPVRSLTRWEKNIEDNGSSHKKEKESGKHRSLSEEQERLLVGYILCLNEQNQEVHLLTVRSWVEFMKKLAGQLEILFIGKNQRQCHFKRLQTKHLLTLSHVMFFVGKPILLILHQTRALGSRTKKLGNNFTK